MGTPFCRLLPTGGRNNAGSKERERKRAGERERDGTRGKMSLSKRDRWEPGMRSSRSGASRLLLKQEQQHQQKRLAFSPRGLQLRIRISRRKTEKSIQGSRSLTFARVVWDTLRSSSSGYNLMPIYVRISPNGHA